MTLATDLASDLGHELPMSNLEIAMSTKNLTWSQKIKTGELFGWFDILLIISDLYALLSSYAAVSFRWTNTVLYKHSTMNSTENRYKILEEIIHSNLLMCSLVRKLRHHLQLEFDAQCAIYWWHASVYGWHICQRVIITQDRSNV